MTTFKELGLNLDIVKSLNNIGFIEPTPIQEKAIPFILESKNDLIALAQTGTGKTAAFSLPILNQINIKSKFLEAIVICPTRELCLQISQDIKKLANYSKGINVVPIYGGVRIDFQIKTLKKGVNIIVGTPGRVSDLIRRKSLNLHNIKWLVLDEADEMLDMGFKDDLDAILAQTPQTRQTLLFSATMSGSIYSIAKRYMKDICEISVGEKNIGAENITHKYYVVQGKDRFDALKRILDSLPEVYGILFCRTRNETQIVADKLKKIGYNTEAIHGDVSQNMRTKIMDRFKNKQIRLLVATDVAARGIDVNNLTYVINYNLPDQNESYTHRTGRTGRAKSSGIAISIITPREVRIIKQLENIVGKKFEYKQILSGEDIYQKKVDNFIDELQKIDITTINEKHFTEAIKNLKNIHKDDLIKLFIAYKFNNFRDNFQSSRDLNAKISHFGFKKDNGNNVNLKINLGRKNNFDIKALFSLVNSNKNLKGIEIGKINLRPEYSVFSVEKEQVEEVIKSLTGVNFKGKNINIVQVSGSDAYSQKSYQKRRKRLKSRGNREFRKKIGYKRNR